MQVRWRPRGFAFLLAVTGSACGGLSEVKAPELAVDVCLDGQWWDGTACAPAAVATSSGDFPAGKEADNHAMDSRSLAREIRPPEDIRHVIGLTLRAHAADPRHWLKLGDLYTELSYALHGAPNEMARRIARRRAVKYYLEAPNDPSAVLGLAFVYAADGASDLASASFEELQRRWPLSEQAKLVPRTDRVAKREEPGARDGYCEVAPDGTTKECALTKAECTRFGGNCSVARVYCIEDFQGTQCAPDRERCERLTGRTRLKRDCSGAELAVRMIGHPFCAVAAKGPFKGRGMCFERQEWCTSTVAGEAPGTLECVRRSRVACVSTGGTDHCFADMENCRRVTEAFRRETRVVLAVAAECAWVDVPSD